MYWIPGWRNYIQFVLETGDVLNDWLTHMPEGIRQFAIEVGTQLVTIFHL